MTTYYTGKEICGKYSDIENDDFGTDAHRFILTAVAKETLYEVPCPFSSNGRNLLTFKEWEEHPENYDGYHTDSIQKMIEYIKKGGTMPPMIVNKNLGLYDGQHRLTAYSMIPEIEEVQIYKEV